MTASDTDDLRKLPTPLNDILMDIGHRHHGWALHFDIGTLGWSMSRLMAHYYRVVAVYDPWGVGPNHADSSFMDVDLEGFIIRLRIVLNDLAFTIRQLFPANTRGMPSPGGRASARNKELSIHDLLKFFAKNPTFSPVIGAALLRNEAWILELRDQRDKIVHYKAKVVIFGDGAPHQFAMLDAAGPEKMEPTPEGGMRVMLTNVFDFVHRQMRSLLNFMHVDLANAIRSYVVEEKIEHQTLGGRSWTEGGTVELFNRLERSATAKSITPRS
jgi:hypothetical protein